MVLGSSGLICSISRTLIALREGVEIPNAKLPPRYQIDHNNYQHAVLVANVHML